MCVLCAKALEAGWRCWVALLQSATPRSADDALVQRVRGSSHLRFLPLVLAEKDDRPVQ